MSTDPTLPLPGAGATGQFPPATDPWSAVPSTQPAQHGPAPQQAPAPQHAPAPQQQPAPPQRQPYPGGVTPTSGPPTQTGVGPDVGAAPGSAVAQIGELTVTSTAVRTPAGEIPLAGSTWQVADYWQSEQKTPTWAIVAAIAGFFVLTIFSLLFLLVKQTSHRGTVQVTVGNGPRQYVARIPVVHQDQVRQIHQQVNYVRSLAAL